MAIPQQSGLWMARSADRANLKATSQTASEAAAGRKAETTLHCQKQVEGD